MRDLVAGCMAARMEGEGVLDLNHMEEALGSTCQLFMAVHCNLELVGPSTSASAASDCDMQATWNIHLAELLRSSMKCCVCSPNDPCPRDTGELGHRADCSAAWRGFTQLLRRRWCCSQRGA